MGRSSQTLGGRIAEGLVLVEGRGYLSATPLGGLSLKKGKKTRFTKGGEWRVIPWYQKKRKIQKGGSQPGG